MRYPNPDNKPRQVLTEQNALEEFLTRISLSLDDPNDKDKIDIILNELAPLTPEYLHELYTRVDNAALYERVSNDFSMRQQFENADRLVMVGNSAIGDCLFNIFPTVQALALLYKQHPELKKDLTVYTLHPSLFTGIEEQFPFVHIVSMPQEYHSSHLDLPKHIPNLEDEIKPNEKVFIFSALGFDEEREKVLKMRLDSRWDQITGIAYMDMDRYAETIEPWQMVTPPYSTIMTASQRLARFLELILEERLFEDPAEIDKLPFPIPEKVKADQARIMEKLGLQKGANIYVIIDTGSVPMKRLINRQLVALAEATKAYCDEEDPTGQIILIESPWKTNMPEGEDLRNELVKVDSKNTPRRIQTARLSLEEMMGLFSLPSEMAPQICVGGTDSGPTQLASRVGADTLLLYSNANPELWHFDRDNTKTMFTPPARELAEHDISLQPGGWDVNWQTPEEIAEEMEKIRAATGYNLSDPQYIKDIPLDMLLYFWRETIQQAKVRRQNQA